jgi:hypothetical protein
MDHPLRQQPDVEPQAAGAQVLALLVDGEEV